MLGTYAQVVTASSVDLMARSPWIFEWFLRYQNPDGGLNCDEAAYLKACPTSSVVSTVPAIEAMLVFELSPDQSEAAEAFIDRGMDYLLRRNLFRSRTSGQIIDQGWLAPAFPRYYHYDIMRGLLLVVSYGLKLERKVKAGRIIEALERLDKGLGPEGFVQGDSNCIGAKTRMPSGNGQALVGGLPAGCPRLLLLCDRPGRANPWLARDYGLVLAGLLEMLDRDLLSLD